MSDDYERTRAWTVSAEIDERRRLLEQMARNIATLEDDSTIPESMIAEARAALVRAERAQRADLREALRRGRSLDVAPPG